MAGEQLRPLLAWLEPRAASAPEALRRRVAEHIEQTPDLPDPAATLAAAGRRALERVAQHSGDRSVALDLLAADGLITLALLHRAEHDPASLATFARALQDAP
jgi:hypothetical protein